MQKIKAGYHKWASRPKYGLQIRILEHFMTKKEVKVLIDKYMRAKAEMLWEALSL